MATRMLNTKPERKRRGSFPPFLALTEAFDLVRAIYEQGGGQASSDLMSQLTGNSSSSSTFIKKTGALKLYGLVSEQDGTFLLTEQGSAIAAPISADFDCGSKKAAFLSVSTFAKLYDRHKGKLLPADEYLRNILEQDVGIPRELAPDWVKAFKESAKAAGLLFTRADGKVQILEAPAIELDRQTTRNDTQDSALSQQATIVSADVSHRVAPPSGATQLQPISASGNNTRFELSDGRVAEFSIPFGINANDAKRLKGYLKGLEFIIDSAIVGEEGPPS